MKVESQCNEACLKANRMFGFNKEDICCEDT